MPIRVCVAGATGWTGSQVTRGLLSHPEFKVAAAIARRQTGRDVGEALGLPPSGVAISASLEEAAQAPIDVLIDYTKPDSVKARVLDALGRGIRVVIGTSGLSARDFAEIEEAAQSRGLGVIAAGNFSLTAALAKHFALIAARHLPSWEIIDYSHADKVDAPSGTTRELAEALAEVKANTIAHPIGKTLGYPEARGASIAGTQVHALRLPGYVAGFEAHFGLPQERLVLKHEAGSGADPYVRGTLLAASKVMQTQGLVRGLDRLIL